MSDNLSRHVAYEQVKLMLDFMGQHVDFATGQLRSLEARHISKRLWTELTQILNSCRGTRKTTDGWSKYWSDFKNKLKNKVRVINKRKRLGSTDKSARSLSTLEKRAVVILGPCFERKVTRLAAQDYRDETVIQKLPQESAEVKVEEVGDPSNGSTGSHMSESPRGRHVEISPDTSVLERHSDDEATSDFEGDSDDAAEPLMSSLYPKWLIEIEQKRAEAELSRARAEEARAEAAAASARAASAQAEALRSLADAASRQADAVARIAAALDAIPRQKLGNALGR